MADFLVNSNVVRFLRKVKSGGIVEVVHKSREPAIIAQIDVPDDRPSNWADETEKEIRAVCRNDAGERGGTQRYSIQYHDASTGEVDPVTVPLTERADDSDDEWQERASPKGIAAQQMKMAEAMFRTTIGGFEAIMRQNQSMMAQQASMINDLMADKLNTHRLVVQMLENQSEREARAEIDREKARAIGKGVDAVVNLLPAVSAAIVEKRGGDVTGMADELAINFIHSLTDEQAGALADLFTPAQNGMLMDLINADKLIRQAREEKKTYVPSTPPSELFARLFESMSGPQMNACRKLFDTAQLAMLLRLGKMHKKKKEQEAAAKKAETSTTRGPTNGKRKA